jgi:hypothetical protein
MAYKKTFAMKPLTAAIVAGLGRLGVSGAANAIHIHPDGLGQVLLFPYYTARAGLVQSVSKVETKSSYKAVKVRFLEGKNSREVNDFNLFLSPQDVWNGAVVAQATPDVVSAPPHITTVDAYTESCNASSHVPLAILTAARDAGVPMPTNEELLKVIERERPIEGYFPA